MPPTGAQILCVTSCKVLERIKKRSRTGESNIESSYLEKSYFENVTTDFDYRYEKAKEICDYESLELSDKDIKLAQNKALAIIYKS